ncbi:MAG: cupin domain-containing protein [Balneolaceae bacterium]
MMILKDKTWIEWPLMGLLLLLGACSGTASETDPASDGTTSAYPQSEVLLKTTTTWGGEPIEWPEGTAEASMLRIQIPVGAETGMHLHPIPSFNYVQQGILEVTNEEGETVRLEAGQGSAEIINEMHNGRSVGEEPVILVIFYASVEGGDLTRSAQ